VIHPGHQPPRQRRYRHQSTAARSRGRCRPEYRWRRCRARGFPSADELSSRRHDFEVLDLHGCLTFPPTGLRFCG